MTVDVEKPTPGLLCAATASATAIPNSTIKSCATATLSAAGQRVNRSLTAMTEDSQPLPQTDQVDRSGGQFSNFRLHGQGGQGAILIALDEELQRVVAIKELLAGSSASAILRFEREALIQSTLQHPGIVPVFQTGMWPSRDRLLRTIARW